MDYLILITLAGIGLMCIYFLTMSSIYKKKYNDALKNKDAENSLKYGRKYFKVNWKNESAAELFIQNDLKARGII